MNENRISRSASERTSQRGGGVGSEFRYFLEIYKRESAAKKDAERNHEILVPVDFSECSWRALGTTVPLARRIGAKIILLHVIDLNMNFPPTAPVDVNRYWKEVRKEAEDKLAEAALILTRENVAVECLIDEGLPFEEITKVASLRNIQLIVIGKRKPSKFWQLFHRHTTERVRERAPCPVLTVGERPEQPRRGKTILGPG